jgi:hypothetical protein
MAAKFIGGKYDCDAEDQQQMYNSNKNLVLGPRWLPDIKIDWPPYHRSEHDFEFGVVG